MQKAEAPDPEGEANSSSSEEAEAANASVNGRRSSSAPMIPKETNWRCVTCDASFSRRGGLRRHNLQNQCPKCLLQMCNSSERCSHIETCDAVLSEVETFGGLHLLSTPSSPGPESESACPLVCPVCQKTYKYATSCEKHALKKHGLDIAANANGDSFPCRVPDCHRRYETRAALAYHVHKFHEAMKASAARSPPTEVAYHVPKFHEAMKASASRNPPTESIAKPVSHSPSGSQSQSPALSLNSPPAARVHNPMSNASSVASQIVRSHNSSSTISQPHNTTSSVVNSNSPSSPRGVIRPPAALPVVQQVKPPQSLPADKPRAFKINESDNAVDRPDSRHAGARALLVAPPIIASSMPSLADTASQTPHKGLQAPPLTSTTIESVAMTSSRRSPPRPPAAVRCASRDKQCANSPVPRPGLGALLQRTLSPVNAYPAKIESRRVSPPRTPSPQNVDGSLVHARAEAAAPPLEPMVPRGVADGDDQHTIAASGAEAANGDDHHGATAPAAEATNGDDQRAPTIQLPSTEHAHQRATATATAEYAHQQQRAAAAATADDLIAILKERQRQVEVQKAQLRAEELMLQRRIEFHLKHSPRHQTQREHERGALYRDRMPKERVAVRPTDVRPPGSTSCVQKFEHPSIGASPTRPIEVITSPVVIANDGSASVPVTFSVSNFSMPNGAPVPTYVSIRDAASPPAEAPASKEVHAVTRVYARVQHKREDISHCGTEPQERRSHVSWRQQVPAGVTKCDRRLQTSARTQVDNAPPFCAESDPRLASALDFACRAGVHVRAPEAASGVHSRTNAEISSSRALSQVRSAATVDSLQAPPNRQTGLSQSRANGREKSLALNGLKRPRAATKRRLPSPPQSRETREGMPSAQSYAHPHPQDRALKVIDLSQARPEMKKRSYSHSGEPRESVRGTESPANDQRKALQMRDMHQARAEVNRRSPQHSQESRVSMPRSHLPTNVEDDKALEMSDMRQTRTDAKRRSRVRSRSPTRTRPRRHDTAPAAASVATRTRRSRSPTRTRTRRPSSTIEPQPPRRTGGNGSGSAFSQFVARPSRVRVQSKSSATTSLELGGAPGGESHMGPLRHHHARQKNTQSVIDALLSLNSRPPGASKRKRSRMGQDFPGNALQSSKLPPGKRLRISA